jgi:hypothetical protein
MPDLDAKTQAKFSISDTINTAALGVLAALAAIIVIVQDRQPSGWMWLWFALAALLTVATHVLSGWAKAQAVSGGTGGPSLFNLQAVAALLAFVFAMIGVSMAFNAPAQPDAEVRELRENLQEAERRIESLERQRPVTPGASTPLQVPGSAASAPGGAAELTD